MHFLCEREQASNEHVFGRGLSRLFAEATPFALTRTPGRSVSGLKVINVKSRAPCKACNGGWMSRSESEAKILLPRMIAGDATNWDLSQQAHAARWTFETALMLDRSSLASRVVPLHHFRFLFEHQLPPASVTVYLARYFPGVGEDHVGVIGSSYRPGDVNARIYPDPYQITFKHRAGGSPGVRPLGHSAAGGPPRRSAQLRLIVPVDDQFLQLWPIRAGDLAWPPAGHHLDTTSLQALARF